jgi:hypothetical protein
MRQYEIDKADHAEVARELGSPQGRVRLEVTPDAEPSKFVIGGIAEEAVLEVVWPGGASRGASVRLQGSEGGLEDPGIVAISVAGHATPWLEVEGPIELAELRTSAVDVRLTGTGNQRVEQLRIEREGSIEGCHMCGATIDALQGEGVVRQQDGEIVMERTSGISVSVANMANSPVVHVVEATSCVFRRIKLRMAPGGRLIECRGNVRFVSCVDAFVVGVADDPLLVGAALDPDSGDEDLPLRNSVFMRVALEGETLSAFLGAAVEASIVDPDPQSVRRSLAKVPEPVREGTAELMLQRLSEKAPRPQAVDIAAAMVLEMRRTRISPWTVDWLLLHIFRILGYGRLVGPPLAVWAIGVGIVLGIRFWEAVDRPGGFISSTGIAADVQWGGMLRYAGDVLLSAALLPVTWIRTGTTADVVGLSGGYLVAARVLLAIPVVFAIGAARSRLRVRPAQLSH